MLWTWSATARSLSLVRSTSSSKPWPALSSIRGIQWPRIIKQENNYQRFLSNDITNRSTPLTLAQTSRAACQAVRLSLKSPIGGVEDALLIVNSLRFSALKQDPATAHLSSVKDFQLQLQSNPSSPLDFTQAVSSRLASHALLHGLIRMRRFQQAHDLALEMMEAGIQFRTRTIATLMRSFSPSKPVQVLKLPLQEFYVDTTRSLSDLSRMTQSPSTKMAMEIFTAAKKSHQRNANGIFSTLIALCIANAEIVLASLLFAFAVKERHNRATSNQDVSMADDTEPVSPSHPSSSYRKQSNGAKLYPNPEMLYNVLKPVRHALEKPNVHLQGSPEDLQHSLLVHSSLQALTNLAFVLDQRLIPFPSVSHLLSTMYRCPRLGYGVWIPDSSSDGDQVENKDTSEALGDSGDENVKRTISRTPKRIIAYTYLHDVLKRLITDPPYYQRNGTRAISVPLDLYACNSLLHYSLRHRNSPTLANSVLKYMVTDRETRWALKPNEETYNILVRSGTLLRNDELANVALNGLEGKVLKTMRSRLSVSHPPGDEGTTHTPALADTPQQLSPTFPLPLSPSVAPLVRPRPDYALPDASTIPPAVMTVIHRIRSLDLGDHSSRCELPNLLYTLTTLFMRYISTGKSDLVYVLHYELFPELNIPFCGIGSRGEKLLRDHQLRQRKRIVVISGRGQRFYPDRSMRIKRVRIGVGTEFRWGITRGRRRAIKYTTRTHLAPSRKELKQRKRARRSMVIRASKYGPRLFSVILNGLLKANRIGAAKAFWKFAKRAEKMSWGKGSLSAYVNARSIWDVWNRRAGEGLEPWLLDETAYTAMLQILKVEWDAPLEKRSGRVDPDASEEEKAEVIAAVRQMLIGRGFTIYRQMKQIQGEVEEALFLREKRREQRTGQRREREIRIGTERVKDVMGAFRFPVLDARFMTAAITLLVLPVLSSASNSPRHNQYDEDNSVLNAQPVATSHTIASTKKPPQQLVMRELQQLERQYAETGQVLEIDPAWAPILDEIGKDLVGTGFDIPPGLKKLFLGKGLGSGVAGETTDEPSTLQLLRPHPPVVPYNFPDAKPEWHPFFVPSMRTRGLPRKTR